MRQWHEPERQQWRTSSGAIASALSLVNIR
jgi:hypothetical protein